MEEFQVLENTDNINYDLLDEKRTEPYDVRKVKMERIKIRSKARWINDGENVTKYFCNTENRNYTSKCMNSIRKENGTLRTVRNIK